MTGIYPLHSSGPGIFLFGLLTELSRRGTFGSIFSPPSARPFSVIGNYHVHSWMAYPSVLRRAGAYLNFVLKGLYAVGSSDIILFNSPPSGIFAFTALLYSRFLRKPSIWIVHGGVFNENDRQDLLFAGWLGITARTVTTMVAVSKALAEIVWDRTHIQALVIHSALSVVQPVSRQALLDRTPAADPTFLFLGRLVPIKRIDLVLRAFAGIVARYPNSKLVLAGSGPEETALRELAKRLDLNQVLFTGALDGDAKVRMLDQSDVLVLASDFETFGLVILEAWARGLGVIGSNAGGIKELIAHDKTGLLFEPRNWMNLFDCMNEMCGDETRKRLALAGYDELIRQYTWETAGHPYYALIRKLARRSDPNGTGT
jgi:glycosyltransferase involved in cell wall biosynthesis